MTTNAFVTGWPVSHSKSPALHGYWLKEYAVDGTYEAVAVEPDALNKFLAGLQASGFTGGNVTIPHKEAAFQITPNLDEAAKAIRAVNTIWYDQGKMFGGNTDAYGFAANLDDYAPEWRDGTNALVLGAGGAARAVVYALREAGYSRIYIANRTLERAESLAIDFGEKCHPRSLQQIPTFLGSMDFVVNTTSLGMHGNTEEGLPDLGALQTGAIVTDIVYTPVETPFLKMAKNLGHTTVDGLGMLLHQAVPGFEKWFGIRPDVTAELRNHILGQI